MQRKDATTGTDNQKQSGRPDSANTDRQGRNRGLDNPSDRLRKSSGLDAATTERQSNSGGMTAIERQGRSSGLWAGVGVDGGGERADEGGVLDAATRERQGRSGGLWKVGVVGGHEEGREERRGGLRRGEGEGCPAFEEISRWRLSKSSVSKMERLQEEVRGKGCRVSVKPVLYCRNWMAHFFFFLPAFR